MNECLPEEEVQEYLNKVPYPGVKAVLNNAIMPIEEHAEQGVRPTPDCQGDSQEEMTGARPTRLATTNVTDWKQEQKEDPVLYQVVAFCQTADGKDCTQSLWSVWHYRPSKAQAGVQTSRLSYPPPTYRSCV